jgi:hypothetical protein
MIRIFKLWLLVTVVVSLGNATDKYSFDFASSGRLDLRKTAAGAIWAKKVLQGYSMKVWLSNQMTMGEEAWDPYLPPLNGCSPTQGLGMEYPVGQCIEHLYGAGPVIGGLIDGVRRVSEAYNGDDAHKEFLPEKQDTTRDKIWLTNAGTESYHPKGDGYSGYYWLHNIQVNRRGCDDDGDGKIDEDELDGQDNDGDWNPLTDDIGADGIPDSLEVSCDGKRYDPVTNPDPAYDNYDPGSFDKCHLDANGNYIRKLDKNKYTEHNGIPDHGEPHVDEDYAALSDQDIYLAATDTFKSITVPGHFPMGIKLFQKTYAWQESFAEGIIPMDYIFVNIGHYTIDSVYVGFFADFDVGPVSVGNYYGDDYACYMPDIRCGYVNNAVDRGSTPAGIVVLGTPRPLDSLKYIWQWHGFTDPGTLDSNIYSWLSGERFPNALIKPCQSPSAPTDTRFFFSFGPFATMNPGDTLKITVALVAGYGVDAGPNNLRQNAQNALKMYLRGFQPPISLPSPPLHITNLTTKPYGVKLDWGVRFDTTGGLNNPLDVWDDSNKLAESFPDTSWRRKNPPCGVVLSGCSSGHRCTYDDSGHAHLSGGRIFEGYRLYRSEDPGGVGNTKYQAQSSTWTLVKQWDIPGDHIEYDVGLDSVYYDTNLVRGKRYWYSVTSFGIPDIAILQIKDAAGNTHFDTLLQANTESAISANETAIDVPFSVSTQLGKVLVVPNPYRADRDYTYENGGYEGQASKWDETKRQVKFIHLPPKCTIRIITLAGDLVATLQHNNPNTGELSWSLLSDSGRAIASGVYIYTVESDYGRQVGKFVLIR